MARASANVTTIVERLRTKYPDARYELNFDSPFQLLIATILAAQCTDERVNAVTPGLFARYPTPRALAEADGAELEELVRPTGFYRQKAKSIKNCSLELVERFGGQVPKSIDELVTLPGVARKTANVVLNMAYHIASGIIADSHVIRVSGRLGLSTHSDGEKVEQDLLPVVPQKDWIQFGAALVLHGRYTCTAMQPACGACVLADFCPKVGVDDGDDAETPTAKAPKHSSGAKDRKGPSQVLVMPSAASVARPRSLRERIPEDWQHVLHDEFSKPYFAKLEQFVATARQQATVFPREEDTFRALHLTPYEEVKVLLLGQDPYHDDGQAHGLCFSVRAGVKPPPSLVNMYKELQTDLGCPPPAHGCLTPWARQGMLMLNAVLTVEAHQPASHARQGWETFTDALIAALNARSRGLVFMLWGGYAQKKEPLIDAGRHRIVKAAHPSPLSMKKFLGSKPYSAVNLALSDLGHAPFRWQLPAAADE